MQAMQDVLVLLLEDILLGESTPDTVVLAEDTDTLLDEASTGVSTNRDVFNFRGQFLASRSAIRLQ